MCACETCSVYGVSCELAMSVCKFSLSYSFKGQWLLLWCCNILGDSDVRFVTVDILKDFMLFPVFTSSTEKYNGPLRSE